jgi:hypothetical protein
MADFSLKDVFSWVQANPQIAGALVAGIGTLADPAQPETSTNTQRVELPEYISPLIGRALQNAESLAGEQYIPYTGQRLADFTQDQQTAFENTRNLQPLSPYQTQGAGIIGEAANRLGRAGEQRWDQQAAEHYMSPYMQSVIDVQKRKAMEDYSKQLPVMDAAAQKAGAFGGSRHGIVQAEAQKNMNQQLQDLQTMGLQSAYTNAQGQFNADMNRQLGTYSQASNLGSSLAGIGQQGFQNQLAANQGLMGIGNQQQQLNQQSLNTGYQDFLAQRQHPYQQAEFLRAAYSGLPMTQQTTSTFTPAPTMTQQLIGNMTAGYGLGQYYPQNPQNPQNTPRP